ncbi:MAG TPA: arginyltransferase [Nevskiaceae bacterium]|nr:arginyltransferase [Nevskiaceae bacterium]
MIETHGVPTRLLVGSEHPCGYLPELRARSAFIDPALPMNANLYRKLLDLGFRRSGGYVYRPLCRHCDACRPVRVPVARFTPDRTQRRCLHRNRDLTLHPVARLGDEHFALYRRYLRARHPGGGMDPDDATAFHEFFNAAWSQTQFWEFRFGEHGALAGVCVVDLLPGALSAVYTFFDPNQGRRSLGTWAILREIEIAHDIGLPYLYLGYWVEHSHKMNYKRRFQPLEVLAGVGWVPLAPSIARHEDQTHP